MTGKNCGNGDRCDCEAGCAANWDLWFQPRYQQLRSEALAAYGGRCSGCGGTEEELLVLEDLEEKRENRSPSLGCQPLKLFVKAKAQGYPAGRYTDLCRNCHAKKYWVDMRARTKGCECEARRLEQERARRELLSIYGDRCECCGISDPDLMVLRPRSPVKNAVRGATHITGTASPSTRTSSSERVHNH